MDNETVYRLSQLNNDFYRDHAASFSESRSAPWPGWERLADSLPADGVRRVLDVACGNLRFRDFLQARGLLAGSRYYAIDACPELLPEGADVSFRRMDIVPALAERDFADSLQAPACDLVACFGFLHHVPTQELRLRLLDDLLDHTLEGGVLAFSLWQFAHDDAMLEKARRTTEQGCAELGFSLDEGDYLLGWNGVEGAWRYCHSFTDAEAEELSAFCARHADALDRYSADGRTGGLNAYLVFRKW